MKREENTLIVLCAGQGKRMGKDIPKMLIPLAGRPLLYWTLAALEKCPAVHSLILAIPPGYRKDFERKLAGWKFHKVSGLIEGGKERTDSTRNALRALPAAARWVGIHEGPRPFVSPKLVAECFRAARTSGAAILAVPSKDTVKVTRGASGADAGLIRETIPRSRCWSAQTPQVFARELAEKMHLGNSPMNGKEYTDDASIAEALGFTVRIVPGSYENIKLTTPEDLALAESLLRKRRP